MRLETEGVWEGVSSTVTVAKRENPCPLRAHLLVGRVEQVNQCINDERSTMKENKQCQDRDVGDC